MFLVDSSYLLPFLGMAASHLERQTRYWSTHRHTHTQEAEISLPVFLLPFTVPVDSCGNHPPLGPPPILYHTVPCQGLVSYPMAQQTSLVSTLKPPCHVSTFAHVPHVPSLLFDMTGHQELNMKK